MKKEKKSEFIDSIKANTNGVDSEIMRKKFLEEIDGNVELLSKLSIDRLEKLEKYYDKIIKQNDEIIKKLEAKNKK